ncbi:MAG: sensor histidine kinase [Bacillota bacterium]
MSLRLLLFALVEQGVIAFMILSILAISIRKNICKFSSMVIVISIIVVFIRSFSISPLIILVTMFLYYLLVIKYLFRIPLIIGVTSTGLIFIIYFLLESTIIPLAAILFNVNLNIAAKYSMTGVLIFLIQISLGITISIILKKSNINSQFNEFVNKNIVYNMDIEDESEHKVVKTLYFSIMFLILQGFLLISINWVERVFPYFDVPKINATIIKNVLIIIFSVLLLFLFKRLLKTIKIQHKKIIDGLKKENSRKIDQELKKQMHDFKNHLGTLNMMLEMDKISRAKKYLNGLINEVTTIQQNFKTGNEVIDALLCSKIIQAKDRNINLNINVLKSLKLPQVNDWDINRIIGNLIDNSIEALKFLNTKKEVEVLINRKDKLNIIKVKTFGVLIPEEVQKNIFKKGYTSKQESGHGLGLYICQQIVKSYQGKIRITKDEKVPVTTFVVELPELEN